MRSELLGRKGSSATYTGDKYRAGRHWSDDVLRWNEMGFVTSNVGGLKNSTMERSDPFDVQSPRASDRVSQFCGVDFGMGMILVENPSNKTLCRLILAQ